jgi:hypothetical protein
MANQVGQLSIPTKHNNNINNNKYVRVFNTNSEDDQQ